MSISTNSSPPAAFIRSNPVIILPDSQTLRHLPFHEGVQSRAGLGRKLREGLLNEPFLALPDRHTEQAAKPLRSGRLDTPRPQVIVCSKLKGFGFRVEGTNSLAQPSDQNGFVPGARSACEIWWRWVRSLHSTSKYASAGTPIWLARCATTLPATSGRRSGNRPSNWNAFNSTAKRRRVTPVLSPSSSSSSGLSVQHWASSSGCHARFMGF